MSEIPLPGTEYPAPSNIVYDVLSVLLVGVVVFVIVLVWLLMQRALEERRDRKRHGVQVSNCPCEDEGEDGDG